jgi:hypothetical protein
MIDSIKNNEPAPLSENVSPIIKDIIRELLDKNPDNRPDTQTIINKNKMQVYIQKLIS